MKEFWLKLAVSVATAVALVILAKMWGLVPTPEDYRIPKGTISAFALTEPPPGWELYEPAQGRFVIGVGQNGSVEPKYALQQTGGVDAYQLVPKILKLDMSGDFTDNKGGTSRFLTVHKDNLTIDARPPYVALLICRKK